MAEDLETAPVARLIFQRSAEGNGPGKIARMLRECESITPGTLAFQLEQQARRISEIDAIIKRFYGDDVIGKLSDERFAKMNATFTPRICLPGIGQSKSAFTMILLERLRYPARLQKGKRRDMS